MAASTSGATTGGGTAAATIGAAAGGGRLGHVPLGNCAALFGLKTIALADSSSSALAQDNRAGNTERS